MALKFSDAELVVMTVLNAALTPQVYVSIPKTRPTTFVVVRRTGGPRRNMVVDDAQLTISSWAADRSAAQDLAQDVRQALYGAAETPGGQVLKVQEFSGPYRDDDDLSKHPAYSQTFSVSIRATVS